MECNIHIDMDNAAFHEIPYPAIELARILRNIVKRIENGEEEEFTIFDINGNRVGWFKITS